jgi:hypothetical protein
MTLNASLFAAFEFFLVHSRTLIFALLLDYQYLK